MRCFLAAELASEVKERLFNVQQELRALGLDASYPNKEQMHVTLCFFGEVSENELKNKIEALKNLSFPAFDLRTASVGFFPNDSFVRVVWAGTGSKELVELQELVAARLRYRDDKPFHAHVTLARIKTPRGREKLAAFKAKHAATDFGVTRVNKIVFKKSLLSPSGAQYECLAEIPLSP